MITINGKYTEARVFTDELEDLARTQIRDVCHHPAFEGSRVRIMPDVHAGAGCVIGFTAELKTDKVIPNLIGVDHRLRRPHGASGRSSGFCRV